jgi:SAM-dependent methyltransferase
MSSEPIHAQQRYERERSFHDQRFASGGSRPASRFYVMNQHGEADFRRRVLAQPPGSRALEYGCGPGGLAFALADQGVDAVGIDISPVAVDTANDEAAARELTSASFSVMNAEHLELPDRSFDLVFGSGILHHLDIARAIDEVARVLRDDGRAVFLEPLGYNPLINLYRRRTPSMRTADEHPLRREDLALMEMRFEQVERQSYSLAVLGALPFLRFRFRSGLVDRLAALDERLFARFPRLADQAWTVVIELRGPRR